MESGANLGDPLMSLGTDFGVGFLSASRRSRGCYQWVLDTACQAGEWLHQPLQFDSATLWVPLTEV